MLPVELHHVATDTQWPVEVQPLSTLLSKPLCYVPGDACLHASPLFSDLLEELSATGTKFSSSALSSHLLSGFLDIILATVSSLRQMKEDPHPFTMPIWSTLIRALCYICFSNVEIFNDTPFILPKNFGKSVFDGRALMLISYLYENSRSTQGEHLPGCYDKIVTLENTCSSKHDNSRGSTEGKGVDCKDKDGIHANSDDVSEVELDTRTVSSESDHALGGDIFDERFDTSYDPTESEQWPKVHCFSSSPSRASSTSSLDMPFHAHVLPGRGRRTNAVLPIICIADRENIVPLIASVAYQRRVWGIEEPLVGVILAKDGFSAQIVLGWTNPPSDTGNDSESLDDHTIDDLPMVHIAYSDTPCAANGVFNLTDPISALAFSQFIIELRDHYDKVILGCRSTCTPVNSSFAWRSDLIDPPLLSEWGQQREESVASWIRGLRTPSSVDTDDDPPPYPITPPPTQHFNHVPMSDPVKKPGRDNVPVISHPSRTKKGGEQAEYEKATTSSSISRSIRGKSTSEVSASNSKLPSISSAIQSCSEFAKRAEYGIGPGYPLSMTTYIYDRYVLSISALKLSSNDAVYENINKYITIYDNMSCFRNPAWRLEEELPVVNGAYLEAVRRCFWKQLLAVRSRLGPEHPLMDGLHQEIVSERLSLFFWVTLGAFFRGQRKSVNEAESRLQWDILIFHVMNGLASEDDGVHIRPLFERSLLLSRNRLVDGLNSTGTSNQVISGARGRALEYHNICLVSQMSSGPGVVRTQEGAASEVARHLLEETENLFGGTEQNLNRVISSIRHRANSEPHTGTCDAVVVLTTDNLILPSSKCKIPNFINIPENDKDGVLPPPLPKEHHDTDDSALLLPAPSLANTTPFNDEDSLAARKTETTQTRASSKSKQRTDLKNFKENLKNSRNSFLAASSACNDHCKKPSDKSIPQLSDELPTVVPLNLGGRILFAILVVEHKRPGDDPAKPLNQARTYLEASVRLLEAHGIKELPVFALATNGNEGVVLMAWCSKDSERVYLIDRCVQKFNISSPIEVLHFVTFLLRLKDYYIVHFRDNPSQIEGANEAAKKMAELADEALRKAQEGAESAGVAGGSVEVDLDWGWWKSAQTKRVRPPKDESGKSKSKLGKVVEGVGNMHLST
ncbi:uncharacterized protein EV420DRAFT_140955 [Desarmillaria tabescens]|uniref:Uncharacterized protein n=1 Tax=Armillaria tabescens TaxID=1929756 RepID=A0AA39TK90_ARMTA|nr:uncharacterized protein EV420DRAFT_140955 [Desarmillaria tabescens]KAK0462012.1 hypothetical protein EV420DRAFT_140955 [Desarmillaria tabescens]